MNPHSSPTTPAQMPSSLEMKQVSYQKGWNIPQLAFSFYLQNECPNCFRNCSPHERRCPKCGEALILSLDPNEFLNYLDAITVFWESSRLELVDMITSLFQPLAPYLIRAVLSQIREELVVTILPNLLHQAVQMGSLFPGIKDDMAVIVEKLRNKTQILQKTPTKDLSNPFLGVLTAYQMKYKLWQTPEQEEDSPKSQLKSELQKNLTEFHSLYSYLSHQTELKTNYSRFTQQFQTIPSSQIPAELVRMNIEYTGIIRVIKTIGFFERPFNTMQEQKSRRRLKKERKRNRSHTFKIQQNMIQNPTQEVSL
jgi:hypothetical protein